MEYSILKRRKRGKPAFSLCFLASVLWAAFNQCESSHIVVYQTQRSLQPSSSSYKVDILWMGDCNHMVWCHSLCFQMLPLGLRSQRKPPILPLDCLLASLQGPLMLSHLFSVCIIDEWMLVSEFFIKLYIAIKSISWFPLVMSRYTIIQND